LLRSGGIDIRILEKPLSEFLYRDSVDRFVEATFRDFPRAHALNQVLRFFGAAELIDARVHRFSEAIDLGHVLNAPGHSHSRERRRLTRRESVAANLRAIVRDRPIREDHSVETVPLAKQIGQQLAIVAGTDLLERPSIQLRSFENRVRRHHARDVRGEGAEEWLDVQVETA
jgi:hypothetical protein